MVKILDTNGNIVEMENPQVVRYGPWVTILDVTRINETYGNQTIVETIKGSEWAKAFEFTGGNVAITLTGYMRGTNKRYIKLLWEGMRNVQAALAHIPGEVMLDSGVGIGNTLLWILSSIMFTFSSEMCFQTNMVIKTMEFEDAPDHRGMYAFSITLEKLSFGILQFVLDLVVNTLVGFIMMDQHLVRSAGKLKDYTDIQANLAGVENPIGESLSSLPSVVESSFDVGQEVVTISDDSQEFPNYPENYIIKPDIDRTLDWKEMPFLTSFPQSFSFNLDDKRYEVYFAVFDEINENERIDMYLRAEIKKDGEYIFVGKIMSGMQYVFGGSLSIYVANFDVSSSEDGMMMFSIKGMVADSS
jgi:hypothetical protein